MTFLNLTTRMGCHYTEVDTSSGARWGRYAEPAPASTSTGRRRVRPSVLHRAPVPCSPLFTQHQGEARLLWKKGVAKPLFLSAAGRQCPGHEKDQWTNVYFFHTPLGPQGTLFVVVLLCNIYHSLIANVLVLWFLLFIWSSMGVGPLTREQPPLKQTKCHHFVFHTTTSNSHRTFELEET